MQGRRSDESSLLGIFEDAATYLHRSHGRTGAPLPLPQPTEAPRRSCCASSRRWTGATGAAGRRRRPLCDLGTGNFTRPPLPFTTWFGYLNARLGSDTSTTNTVRIPQRPRLDASYDFGHRSRMPHAWVPCGYQTRTLATLLPTCVCKLHQSRLTPCGEFVHDGLVATLARCSLPSRAPLAELVVCDCQ